MQCKVDEIGRNIYRLSTFHPDYGIQFNQILINDDEPFLMHTGFKSMFPTTLAGLASIINPANLRWFGFSHFESDECGALNEWLRVAPNAQPVCSFIGAMVNVKDFADRAPRPLADGAVIKTGRHRLRFLSTPHLPHGWDAGLFFDEIEQVLLCSDLFFHRGDPEPIVESEIVGRAREAIKGGLAGPLANDLPYTPYTDSKLKRLAALEPGILATMHGSSFRGDGGKAILGLAGAVKDLLGKPESGL